MSDAETLLRTEHAVARVLADAAGEADAYPRLIAAIGASLGWDTGALWQLDGAALERVAAWNAPEPFDATSLHPGEGLPGAVYTSGGPAWIADVTADAHRPRGASALRAGLHAAFAFPITSRDGVLGVVEFLSLRPRAPDDALLATMTSLGGRIGQAVERWRADARRTAILDAAFDAIITMDGDGNVVEVNRETERMFGYAAREMVGEDLAELIIPGPLREPHRRGLRRYLETGRGGWSATRSSCPRCARTAASSRSRSRSPARGSPARRSSPASSATSPSATRTSRSCATSPSSRPRCVASPRSSPARTTPSACSRSPRRRSRGCSAPRRATWSASSPTGRRR